jgi:hypothetical protein
MIERKRESKETVVDVQQQACQWLPGPGRQLHSKLGVYALTCASHDGHMDEGFSSNYSGYLGCYFQDGIRAVVPILFPLRLRFELYCSR